MYLLDSNFVLYLTLKFYTLLNLWVDKNMSVILVRIFFQESRKCSNKIVKGWQI